MAGHLHTLFSVDFGAGKPGQLVVGTGGDSTRFRKRDCAPDRDGPGRRAPRPSVFAMDRFGYFVLRPPGPRKGPDKTGGRADDWAGVFRDLSNQVVARCTLHAGRLACEAA